jgi:hypothetical protein
MILYQAYRGWTYTIESLELECLSRWYIFNPQEEVIEFGTVISLDDSSDDIHNAVAKAKKAIEFYS